MSESPIQTTQASSCVKRELPERDPPPPAKRATPLPPATSAPRSPTPPSSHTPSHQSLQHSNGLGAAFKITSRGNYTNIKKNYKKII